MVTQGLQCYYFVVLLESQYLLEVLSTTVKTSKNVI